LAGSATRSTYHGDLTTDFQAAVRVVFDDIEKSGCGNVLIFEMASGGRARIIGPGLAGGHLSPLCLDVLIHYQPTTALYKNESPADDLQKLKRYRQFI
jgi:hypothetical protein